MTTPEQRARKAAHHVLDTHNSAGQLPVPVERIAADCGCALARNQDPASTITSFAVVSAAKDRMIGLNTAQGVRSQRFAIAHALGHHELHRQREITVCRRIRALHRDPEAVEADMGDERQANLFALELLMPADSVMHQARTYLGGQADPGREQFEKHLAEVFNVPWTAIACRLVDLGILGN